MELYPYKPDANRFSGLGVSSEYNIASLYNNDRPLRDEWVPLRFHDFEDNPTEEGHFPSLTDYYSVPLMSYRAWQLLEPLIGSSCEILPIIHPKGRMVGLVHVMCTLDCVDVNRSEVKRYSDGHVMRVVRYAFKEAEMYGKHIFKLPREVGAELVVDDTFRSVVEANSLNGLLFRPFARVA